MIVKYNITPDEIEYLIRMMMDILKSKNEPKM